MELNKKSQSNQALKQRDSEAQFNTVEQLFEQALNSPAHERAALLDELCSDKPGLKSEVNSLVDAAASAAGFMSAAPTAVDLIFADRLNPQNLLDKRFGPYRLLNVLERGGMGVVYLAERVDGHYEEKVAIKFSNYKVAVKSLKHRFSRETQILAQLRHPNVARMHDAGTSTDGYPYIVMEYIAGDSIDNYCRINTCSPQHILSLMQRVCEAVQHAHQNLIVHCDLKPDNILVTTSGNPILLDFGIAQVLGPIRNLAGTPANLQAPGAMTPQYAAPEQWSGDLITTATDVYALGSILYRLLTRCAPQTNDESSTNSGVCSGKYSAPSTVAPAHLRKHLKGDLDNIILKALRQEPGARYESAQALSDDISRYLKGCVVHASSPRYFYRCCKFAKRHILGVALTSMILVSILAGAFGTIVQWQHAQAARITAESSLNEIRQLANTIVFEVPETVSALPGSTPMRERLLNKSVAYLDRLSSDQQDAGIKQELANAYHELATIQGNPAGRNLRNPESALQHFEKSIEIRNSLLVDNSENSQIKLDLASSYTRKGIIYGTFLNTVPQARLLTDKCNQLLQSIEDTRVPGALRQRLDCLTLSAHWANREFEHQTAATYLSKAGNILSSPTLDNKLLPQDENLRLQGRLHEEWAEINSRTNNPLVALWHENQRLKLWLQFSPEYKKRERLLGFAYHGLANRLAGANREIIALNAYKTALIQWRKWRANYPSDAGAATATAIVHAELANLVWHMRSDTSMQQLACEHYSQSIGLLDAISAENARPIPKRYTWSPTASEIREQHSSRCAIAGTTFQQFVIR